MADNLPEVKFNIPFTVMSTSGVNVPVTAPTAPGRNTFKGQLIVKFLIPVVALISVPKEVPILIPFVVSFLAKI